MKGVNRISFGMDDAEEHWTRAALHGCGNCRGNTLQKVRTGTGWEEEGVWDHFPGQKAGEAEPARRWWRWRK